MRFSISGNRFRVCLLNRTVADSGSHTFPCTCSSKDLGVQRRTSETQWLEIVSSAFRASFVAFFLPIARLSIEICTKLFSTSSILPWKADDAVMPQTATILHSKYTDTVQSQFSTCQGGTGATLVPVAHCDSLHGSVSADSAC